MPIIEIVRPARIADFGDSPLIVLSNNMFVIVHRQAVQVFDNWVGWNTPNHKPEGAPDGHISEYQIAQHSFGDELAEMGANVWWWYRNPSAEPVFTDENQFIRSDALKDRQDAILPRSHPELKLQDGARLRFFDDHLVIVLRDGTQVTLPYRDPKYPMTSAPQPRERFEDLPIGAYRTTAIGDKLLPGTDGIGGDKRLLRLGYKAELIVKGADGGPELVGAFPTVEAANQVRSALELAARV